MNKPLQSAPRTGPSDQRWQTGTNGGPSTHPPSATTLEYTQAQRRPMTHTATAMNLQHYLAHRRRYEALMWVVFILITTISNSIVVILDLRRLGESFHQWEPLVWETSSGLMILILIPALIWFNNRFPLREERWRRNLLAHIGASIAFSALHVAGMVAIRHWVYSLAGGHYDFGPWLNESLYEYLKDARTYATFLAIIYAYDFILRRLQGAASLPDHDENSSEPADRFLVKKLGKEFLVKIEDIHWLEAAGNYVTLHANGHMYPLRDTMTKLEQRLGGHGFIRVHRGVILNLDSIAEIEPLESGDARAQLTTGVKVPISRRYRARLKERLEAT